MVSLDKSYGIRLDEQLGEIAIRVVVFHKRSSTTPAGDDDLPLDLGSEEDYSAGDSEVNSYLELPRKGKLCCVFVINGQRHHGLDNSFIVTELKMKYLRKRMIILVDLDGLTQRATAEIIQGSRSGLYEGYVYQRIRERLVATLQNDPDLLELEEEAEEELSQLTAGDTAVQQALDQLIEQHFDRGEHAAEGTAEKDGKRGHFFAADGTPVEFTAVSLGENGQIANGPVLVSSHAAPALRLRPNSKATLKVAVAPESEWQRLKDLGAFFDTTIAGLTCRLSKGPAVADVEMDFVEPADFDAEDYPLEATLRVLGTFQDVPEPRLLEKSIIIRPAIKRPPPPPRILNDVPTYLRVTSHQPVRLIAGGPDTHVKLVWDGKDELSFGPAATWTFRGECKSHPAFPAMTFTRPTNGRFEVLLHTPEEFLIGTKLEFEIQAAGPSGATLAAPVAAEVVAPPSPRKTTATMPLKGQRRPPYKVVYVNEADFGSATRWGDETWDVTHAGAFIEPSESAPLTLCINQDFGLWKKYSGALVEKKADEQRMQEKKTKYTSHIAYHLYQMYLSTEELKKAKETQSDGEDVRVPDDDEMQGEINRVASTLIRLMEVMR
jgi:hypothetical protein